MSLFEWADPIRELGPVTKEQFAEVRRSGQPAVFRGLAADWPAIVAGNESDDAFVDYLKRFSTSRKVPALLGEPEIKGRFFYNSDISQMNFQRGVTPLDPFLDRMLRDRGETNAYSMAVQSEYVDELLPGFEKENPLDLLDEVRPRAWIGNRIQVAPHYDLYENLGVVTAGRRRFTVFPPEQLPNLYAGPFELTPAGTPVSLVDTSHPDLDKFPKFAEAMEVAQCAVLGPGDAIYIPYHWWHGVDSLEPVNLFVNYWWNEAPSNGGRPYDALMHAFFAFKTLPPDQREVWRHVFEHYVFQANGDPAEHLPANSRGILGEPTPALLDRMRMTLKKIAEAL